MAPINKYLPQSVSHPGATLEEKLNEMGISIKEFALRSGKPEKTIIAIIKELSSITQEMAIKFENITKIPAGFWMRNQMRYDEYKTRERLQILITEAEEWTRKFPYPQMADLYGLPKTRKVKEKTINLFQFFAVSSHTAWENLYMKSKLKVAAYTTLAHTHEPHAISAWLRQGELQAKQIDAPDYDAKKFKINLAQIKSIMAEQPDDYFSQLQQLCLDAGVKLVYTPKMPKAPISGSTRWIHSSPLIQLTARYRQNDRFWFTFFHEAGHILLHGKKYISLENIDFLKADPEKEQEANNFAEEWTFPKKLEQEVLKAIPLKADDIVLFAKKFNTHPALIFGRFHHKKLIPYSIGCEFIEPINLSVD